MMNSAIVPVLRTNNYEDTLKVFEVASKCDFKYIELTYSIPNVELIYLRLKEKFPQIVVGVGTVNTLEQVKAVSQADFIVSPAYNEQVAKYCYKEDIKYIPGCLTPTEILNAHNSGCHAVKIFPANFFGPKYLDALVKPLPDLKIMVSGGVNLETIDGWLARRPAYIGLGGEHLQSPIRIETLKNYLTEIKERVNG